MMLSDLGAEVVKIEKSDGGDETRSQPQTISQLNSRILVAGTETP
ncbi:MAG TPA: CoA transferase [Candidatus Bathyarchaeia archaeon]|nr:CoA transferase [Candidatus Bathyarchaeia archaeon]